MKSFNNSCHQRNKGEFSWKNVKVKQVLPVRNLILGKITKIIIKVFIIKLKI